MIRCGLLRGQEGSHGIVITKILWKGVILFMSVLLMHTLLFAEEKEFLIKDIEIRGNTRMDAKTLLARLATRPGDVFSPERIQADVKALYGLGYFNQVAVESDPFEGGVRLIFVLEEKPALSEITFEGNVNISADRLKEHVAMKPGAIADKTAIDREVEKIVALYKKEAYYQVAVIPLLNRLSERKAALTFLITEGKQAYIRHIQFEGNKAISRWELQKSISTKEYFWLTSWFTESGRYQEEVLDEDTSRMTDFYLDRGYLQIQVGKPNVTFQPEENSFDITFSIVEGDRWTIEKIAYTGNQRFNQTVLAGATKSQAGAFFSKKQLREDIQKMLDLYGREGYLFARVDPQVTQDPVRKTADITFHVEEGNVIGVRDIEIRGNDKTRDYVIRREIRQNEREQVNTDLLRRSFQRLHNLNFFETIDIVPRKVDDGKVDLAVTVTEKSTGSLMAGAGYSSLDRLIGQFEMSQGNLFGKGQLLRARAEFGKRRNTYTLTFREPYLLDTEVSGTANLFNQDRLFEQYEEQRAGGSLAVGKAFGEFVRSQVSLTRETLLLTNVRTNAPRFIQAQASFGKTLTYAAGFSITRDTRDFMFDPKEGTEHTLGFEYAGTFLGGDNDYYKITVDSGRFFPGPWDHVFSLHGAAGFADGIGEKTLPVGERFFVGGINSVRGFRFGRAGPLEDGAIKGGNKQLFFNAEYLIPLVPEAGLKAVFFYDYGRGFDDAEPIGLSDLRQGAGAGFRWVTPMGPLRFEWGRNLHPRSGEPETEFDFSIGTLF